MKRVNCIVLAVILSFACFLSACGGHGISSGGQTTIGGTAAGGQANAFNPYMQKKLPNTRGLSVEGQAFGGQPVTIEAEAAHRPHWREEIYPVVFGRATAPHEILVVLDFAKPQSWTVWQAVAKATTSLSPEACKVVVFALNSENYGTDLMGMAIWHIWARNGQAMAWLDFAFREWHAAKAAQRKSGRAQVFNNEYDSAVAGGYPIHYRWLMGLKPAVPEQDELRITRYCYDAGNVNMFQTVQINKFYGINSMPAVLVDGKGLSNVSAESIREALAK